MAEDQFDTSLAEQLSNDGRAKRQRKEVHDPDFSNFTSSDEYSSSDAESSGSDYDEDDPERPWCVCKKPQGSRSMIGCDGCSYWFHGSCVGVSDSMIKRIDKEGKDWFCAECQPKIDSGLTKQEIPNRIVKKEKRSKTNRPGKRGRGRPRKTDTPTRESARLSSRLASRKSSSSLDTRLATRKNPNKYDAARRESFEQFGDEQRLKDLIRERKQAFLFKRQLAQKERLAKIRELGIANNPVTASLGQSLDSLATSTNSPNMNNLPMNPKSEPKDRTKHNIVLQINTKKDGEVTAVVKKKRKHSEFSDQVVDDLFTADPIQMSKRPNTEDAKPSVSQDEAEPSAAASDRSVSDNLKSEKSNLNETNERTDTPSTPKKKRKNSESSTPVSFGSKDIVKKIQQCLESRAKQLKDFESPSDEAIEKLALEIESQLIECFKEGTQKYLNKYRSLIFNFGKNQELVKNVLSGEIQPARLVRMSPEEMAPHELAKWRERHSKHEIELIKHNAQLAFQQVIVKKTHKGEEVIPAPDLNDPDDPSAEVNNQETPTTASKSPIKEQPIETSTGITPELIGNAGQSAKINSESLPLQPESSMSLDHPVLENADKNSSMDDIKLETRESSDLPQNIDKSDVQEQEVESSKVVDIDASKVQQNEPKRYRVSIDSSLDFANLSKIRDQPLIQPSERPQEICEYSPSKVTPDDASEHDGQADEDEELYDPETMLPSSSNLEPSELTGLTHVSSSSNVLWSGSLTMSDVGRFSSTIIPVAGDVSFMHEEIGQNLVVCGRIRPEQVAAYIKQLKATTKNTIVSFRFQPKSDEDNKIYDSLFDYLYTRNRYGVVDNKAYNQILKDFYIIPIHEGNGIPEYLKPHQGLGLDKGHPNCLLGLLVKTKRPTSALGGSSSQPVTSTF